MVLTQTEVMKEIMPTSGSSVVGLECSPKKFLLCTGYDVYDDFLKIIDDIENGYAELEDYKKDQSVFDEEEIEFLKTNIDDWEKQIAEIKSDYLKKNEKADWEKEVEKVNEWWKAKEM